MRTAVVAMLAVGAMAVAGCGKTISGTARPISASVGGRPIALVVPSGFDACAIPQDVLTSVYPGLHKGTGKTAIDDSVRGHVRWMGCVYQVSDGFLAGISVTNLTVDHVRDRHFSGEPEYFVSDRTVLPTYQAADPTGVESCVLYAQMRDGSLEFSIRNHPGSNRFTGHMTACAVGRMVVDKVVPTIPAGV
ncbi:DUF3558 domain-containing protein (plasmid) [Nocardia sp. NBC_01377]|uniref:DUF3558 family protein n=1 Tax=Nocardia sp. NBC_01377 TaxID=2903595 RepID=UPI002F90FFCB